MASSIAPRPGRVALARAAGLRPGARWLRVSGYVALALLLVPRGRAAWIEFVGALGSRSSAPTLEASRLALCAETVAPLFAWLLLGALAVELAAAGLAGQLGPVSSHRRRRLGRVGPWRRRGAIVHLALASCALLLLAQLLAGVLAGGARAVDASAAGLAGLWTGWGARAGAAAACVLLLVGLVERRLGAYARWRALHRSADEVLAQRREHG